MRLDLSERDETILRAVQQYRLLTSGQIERLFFAGRHASSVATRRRCQAVLRRLVGAQLLDRLERRQGGIRAGSTGFTYRLTTRGRRAVEDTGGKGRGPRQQPTVGWSDHTIACAEIAVRLCEARRAGTIEELRLTSEPATWRRFIGRAGQVEILKPDLLVELVTNVAGERLELRWFVEVDRGTEHLPVALRKCQQYQAYWRSHSEEHPVFPRVLWSVPDLARAQAIAGAIGRSTGFTPGLFAVATTEQATALLTGRADPSTSST